MSKSFNLSMMKCAYLFWTNPDHLERIQSVGQHRQSMNTLGIVAAEAAYNECEDWLDQLLVDHAHIHLNPGSAYGLGSDGRMRMNLATSRQLVERALGNMAQALATA